MVALLFLFEYSFNRDKNIVFEEFDLRSVVVSQDQWMSLIGFNN